MIPRLRGIASNKSMQWTAMRAVADAERYGTPGLRPPRHL
jgi:hypothetical protein